jgi:hypothetical protein
MPDAAHAKAAIGLAAMHHGPKFAAKIKAKARKLGYGKSVKVSSLTRAK